MICNDVLASRDSGCRSVWLTGILTGNATDMEVPSSATISVRTARVANTRTPRLPRLNSSAPLVGIDTETSGEESPGVMDWGEASGNFNGSAIATRLLGFYSRTRVKWQRRTQSVVSCNVKTDSQFRPRCWGFPPGKKPDGNSFYVHVLFRHGNYDRGSASRLTEVDPACRYADRAQEQTSRRSWPIGMGERKFLRDD